MPRSPDRRRATLPLVEFPLTEHLVIHRDVADLLSPDEIVQGLARHAAADWWGDLVPEVAYGGRLRSAHGQGDRRSRIFTEADRSLTTVLLPNNR
jgi:hypothetical protein